MFISVGFEKGSLTDSVSWYSSRDATASKNNRNMVLSENTRVLHVSDTCRTRVGHVTPSPINFLTSRIPI